MEKTDMDTPSARAWQAKRIMARLAELSAITEQPGTITRRYLTPAHKKANALVGRWMQEAGMETHVDEAGNICGFYAGSESSAPAILLSSHLDTVINAGAYDGCLGVITAIEAVSTLHSLGIMLKNPVRVIGFADEEGTRFGVTYLGSAAIAGLWNEAWFRATDSDGVCLSEAMRAFGLNPAAIGKAAIPKKDILECYELHIEQGIVLERAGLALGAVTGINGSKRFHMRFTGRTGHAGTIPMSWRHDSMNAAAEAITSFEAIAREYEDRLYCTVGYISCQPNLANCISGEVAVRLDIRAGDKALLDEADTRMHAAARRICSRRGIAFSSEMFFQSRLVKCSEEPLGKVRLALKKVQGKDFLLSSGAGHDSASLALAWPMAMIFMRCREGLSHCPEEAVAEEDTALALSALLELLCRNYA